MDINEFSKKIVIECVRETYRKLGSESISESDVKKDFIKNCMEKYLKFYDLDDKCVVNRMAVKDMDKGTAGRYYYDKKLNTHFVDFLRILEVCEDKDGSFSDEKIMLQFSFIITILHELCHFKREVDKKNNKYSGLGYNSLKEELIYEQELDCVLSLYGDSYYDNNYKYYYIETQANIEAYTILKNILREFDDILKKEEFMELFYVSYDVIGQLIDRKIDEYTLRSKNPFRIPSISSNLNSEDVHDQFDYIIRSNRELLRDYPIFNIEYYKSGDYVLKRGVNELLTLREELDDDSKKEILDYIIRERKIKEVLNFTIVSKKRKK